MSDPQPSPPNASPAGSPIPNIRPAPQVPDHVLLRRIGSGAYGEVWLARSVVGTCRAVKIVHRDSFKDPLPYEREYRGIQKFEPVSRSHDGFVDVLQIGRNEEAGHFYYVMELADGVAAASAADPELTDYSPKTLRTEIQQRGRLPFDECLSFATALTIALGHLHRQGLIHRDIKPSNIIFVGGIPKLADIGLVSAVGEARSFVGTEGFIPPEGPNSPHADIYSLGKVLYEMSMGKDRLDFPEPFTALGQAPDSPDLEELNTIIIKACAPDPRARYQTAEDMSVDLALLRSGKSVKARRMLERRLAIVSQAAAITGFVAVLVLGGFLYQRRQAREAERLQRVAEDLTARMQIRNAESLLARGNSSAGLAELADVLRREPGNRVAAERIMAVLAQRSFLRPVGRPITSPSRLPLSTTHTSARLSPDGRHILTVGEDHSVRVWDARTADEAIPALQHQEEVYSAEFSPDGSRLVTASDDRTACLVDIRSGSLACPPLTHDRAVMHATFSPDGRWVATGSFDGTARVFDSENGRLVAGPLVHVGRVNVVAFSPDSRHLATAMEGGRIRIWDISSARELHRFRLEGPVRLLRFSGDGKWIAAAIYADHPGGMWRVQVWDAVSRQPATGALFHPGRIYGLDFSPDSRRLVTATADNVARVWDVRTGAELFQLPHSSMVYSAAFSPDGHRILTASVDRSARLWDAATGVAISEAMLHDGRVIHAEFSRDGSHVLTAGWEDRMVKLWELPTPHSGTSVLSNAHWVLFAEFDPTGREALLATGGASSTAANDNRWYFGTNIGQTVTLWNPATKTPQVPPPLPPGAEAVAAQYTHAGPMVLISERRDIDQFAETGWIWDPGRGAAVGGELEHAREITCAHFSGDGLKVATGTQDGTVRVWDVQQGIPLTPPLSNGAYVKSVRFNGDGTKVVAATQGKAAIIWNVSGGGRQAAPLVHNDAVWFAQFDPKGDRLVTASLDYTARIWSSDGGLIATLQHRAPVEHAEFSPDGNQVATASGDTVRLWNAGTGRQLIEPLTHAELVVTVQFSPDGLRLITASKDRTAQLWDARTGLKLADPFHHDDLLSSARFSPDGQRAITASLDRTSRIWEVANAPSPIPAWLPELAEVVGGQRLNPDRIPEPVIWGDRMALSARLDKASDQSPLLRRARTVLGILGDRPVQPPGP